MRKPVFPLLILFCCAILCDSCSHQKPDSTPDICRENNTSTFFGDSTLTIISSNRPNGYLVKFFQTKDMTLVNLSRGDSINQYVALSEIPRSLCIASCGDLTDGVNPIAVGTYKRELNIPVEENLSTGIFFMDVNFDGNEELLIEYPGYNRTYYACFDIANGSSNVTPGILQPMDDRPFNNIVSGSEDIFTEFDHEKKTIHIYEQLGCCSHIETWCEMVSDWEYDTPKIQVVRQEEVSYTPDGYMTTTISKRIDGELTPISTTHKKI